MYRQGQTSEAQVSEGYRAAPGDIRDRMVHVPCDGVILEGTLRIPPHDRRVVLFAHGTGNSRHSSPNHRLAKVLEQAGLATLLIDLLSSDEESLEAGGDELR